MPKLSETLVSNIGLPPNHRPVEVMPERPPQGLEPVLSPIHNTFIRCPIPPIWQVNTDSVRQFYIGGRVPQMRIYAQSLLNR
jgi:hypothetical protein